MAAKTGPNLGLQHSWPLHDNTWKPGMDANLATLDALVNLVVTDIDYTASDNPVAGTRVLVPQDSGNPSFAQQGGKLAVFDGTAWRFFSVPEYLHVPVASRNEIWRRVGNGWQRLDYVSTLPGTLVYRDELSRAIADARPDLTPYVTEEQLSQAIDALPAPVETDLSGYASLQYVDEALASIPQQDLTPYVTSDYVANEISQLRQNDLAGLVRNAELAATLNGYVLKGEAVTSVNGLTGTSVNLSAGDVGAIPTTAFNQPGGVAQIGDDGLLSSTVLPAIRTNTAFPDVQGEAAMLALEAMTGDIAIRADVPENYILKQTPATDAANWVKLNSGDAPDLTGYAKTADVNSRFEALPSAEALNMLAANAVTLEYLNTQLATVGVASIDIDEQGNWRIELKDGTVYSPGRAVGIDGVSVVGATINPAGNLIQSLSNGTTLDAGYAKGGQGDKGDTGPRGARLTVSSSAPSVAGAIEGDSHINTVTFELYRYSSGTWSVLGSIKGRDATLPVYTTSGVAANGEKYLRGKVITDANGKWTLNISAAGFTSQASITPQATAIRAGGSSPNANDRPRADVDTYSTTAITGYVVQGRILSSLLLQVGAPTHTFASNCEVAVTVFGF